jgi:hypothetical protein
MVVIGEQNYACKPVIKQLVLVSIRYQLVHGAALEGRYQN